MNQIIHQSKMDVKIECNLVASLCYGCLSTERYVNCVTGELSEMFFKIRNDDYQNQCQNLLLCWECIALVKKFKMFQTRIKTAQHLLLQYLETYYIKDETTRSMCLSSLSNIYKFTYDEELSEEINNDEQKLFDDDEDMEEKNNVKPYGFDKKNKNDKDNKESLIEDEIILELKQECENDIKVETYYSDNGNDSDYYETENKNDNVELKNKTEQKSKKKNIISNENSLSFKRYKNFTTVTENDEIKVKDYLKYSESVQISIKEYDKLLKKERNRYGYTNLPFQCKECGLEYFQRMDLLRHVSLYHNSELIFPRKCAACRTMTSSVQNLTKHWMSVHTQMKRCTLCMEICRTDAGIKRHVRRVHGKMYTCNNCLHRTYTVADFIKHYRTAHETLVCDICNVSCRKKKSMVHHMKLMHLPAFCKLCNRSYINHKTYTHHNRITHPELSRVDTRKEMSYCVECDKQYTSAYKYRKHLKDSVKHTPKEKIKVPCPDCGKIFTRTSFMKNHYNFVHLKMNKHCCNKCDKKYTTGYGLRKHIERVHKKILPVKDKICDLCGRGFATNKILTNHRRTHTGERPYKCMHCPAAFVQKFAMQTHQKTQHKNMELKS